MMMPFPTRFFAVALVSASAAAQDFAPTSIPSGSRLDTAGTIVENGNSFPDYSSFQFSGAALSAGASTGTFQYTKTSAITGTITYSTSQSDPDLQVSRTGTLTLVFSGSGVGTYSQSGNFQGVRFGTPFSGSFTGSGNFDFLLPLTFSPLEISDNFDDNLKNAQNWGVDYKRESLGAIKEISKRLEFSSTATGFQDIYRPWILNPPSYDRDWEVVVDVVNQLNVNGYAGLGLEIVPAANRSRLLWFDLAAERLGGAIQWKGFQAMLGGGSRTTAASSSNISSLRISFDASEKVLRCYYDINGPAGGHAWFPFASYGIDGDGGATGNESWGMSGSDLFQVSLSGFSDTTRVVASTIYFDDFRIRVEEPSTDTLYEAWKREYFGDPASPNAADAEDLDRDGIPNLLEYAFGLNPVVPDPAVMAPGALTPGGLPSITAVGTGQSRLLALEYFRRKASTEPAITYEPQFSDNLSAAGPGAWQAATGTETVTSIDDEWERVVIIDGGTPGKASRFGRVNVTASAE